MKRQYLMTERAHYMCPNMHFGILMEIESEYKREKVEASLYRMAEAHPFLKSRIASEAGTDRLYYEVLSNSQIELVEKEDISTLWEDYKSISQQAWNVFEDGLFKTFVYPKVGGMKVLFVAHHLLVDGRGLLELAVEFADDYVGGSVPVYVEEELLGDITDLPPGSALSRMSKLLVRQANKQWEKEKHRVTYEQYANFIEDYAAKHPIEYMSYDVSAEDMERMKQLCRENKFSINDLLMAHMYIKTETKKIIIAVDIRNKLAKYRKGALGNYSSAMGITCKSKTSDIVETAKEVHKLVQKHLKNNRALMLVLACYFAMNPTLLDAAAISALGGFESKAGRFVGGRMFGFEQASSYSITNLGKVENENIKSLMFIPPASPAVKLTLGVVTLNGSMKACSSRNV